MEPAQSWVLSWLCPWGAGKDAHIGVLVKPPSHRTATTLRPSWRPRESTGSPCGRQISDKRSSLWLDRAALARRSDARPLWAQLRFHYDLCISTTLIPRPHGALDTRSVRPLTTLQRCHYDIGDRTTLLGRSRRVCCAHTASVPRFYGDHRRFAVYLAPFHGKLDVFDSFF